MTGVGGQGILSAAFILSETAFRSGFDVKKNEIHGMSQRGGSVCSHIRWGSKIYAPVIPEGEVDFLLAFEKMETLRRLSSLHKKTTIIINDMEIPPVTVSRGDTTYPQDVINRIKKYYPRVVTVKAGEQAARLGDIRIANTIILGVLAGRLGFDLKIWQNIIKEKFKQKAAAVNLKGFDYGLELNESLKRI